MAEPQQVPEIGQSEKRASAPTFAVGDCVQVELSGAYLFNVPQTIVRIDQDDLGGFWYFFDGSNTGIPEAALRRTGSRPNEEPGYKHQGDPPRRSPMRATLAVDAWGDLPNAVALNHSVSAANLVLLALRTTLKDFDLGVDGLNIAVRGKGLGRDVVERANTEAVSLGLLERRQPGGRPGTKFRYAVERLTLPEPGALGRRKVQRSWWRGELSLKELAVLLYLRAAGRVLCRELAKRFGWTRPTAMAALRALEVRGLITSSSTRMPGGAFGPTHYTVIQTVPRDLGAAATAASQARALGNEQPKKSQCNKPGHGNPGRENPGHVRTALQRVPPEQNLATLDSELSVHTSQSEALANETPPPAAAACSSAGELQMPSASKARPTLTDWQAAPFFRKEGRFIVPFTNERVTSLEGWRAMVARHGGAPDHLVTPWAHRQAEHLVQQLALETTVVESNQILDAIAYWVAAETAAGRTIRSLALIGQPLAANLASGSGSRIFDRPSSLPQARYDEVSKLAAEWATSLGKYATIDERSLTSTMRIEYLAEMLDRYGQDRVASGINRMTKPWRDAGKPGPEGRIILGWSFFETDIAAVLAEHNAPRQGPTFEKLCEEKAAWNARLRKLAPAWVDRLETEGAGFITVRRERLLNWKEIDALSWTLRSFGVEPEQVEATMHRFVDVAIAQRATGLASWRKALVRLAVNFSEGVPSGPKADER